MSNPYISLLQNSWRYAQGAHGKFVLIYFLFLCANIIFAFVPILYGSFINDLQNSATRSASFVWIYVASYLGLQLLQWLFHGPGRILEREMAFDISRNFLDDSYHKLLLLPVQWHNQNHTAATVNRLKKAYLALRNFFQNSFGYLQTLIQFCISFVAMTYFAPVFGLTSLALGMIAVIIIYQFDKPFIESLEEVNEHEHVLSAKITDNLANIVTVIILGLEKGIRSVLQSKFTAMFVPFRRNTVIGEWKWFSANMMVSLIYCVMVVGYFYSNSQPGMPINIGGLVTLIAFVTQFTNAFYNMAAQYNQIIQFHTDLKAVDIIDKKFALYHRIEAVPISSDWKCISIENLSFDYEDKHVKGKSTLNSVNLTFNRGERIAILGKSGSGKSTLLALLRGLHEPIGAKVIVDGKNIKHWTNLGGVCSLFPQEPEIFENTIEYNITLGLPFTENEINQACTLSHFQEVIDDLPEGLQTKINEKGIDFSGGQKQRLAMARAILASKASSILLLDEPTNRVDPRMEKQILEKLFDTSISKTIIYVTHNTELLHYFDKVYIFEGGAIAYEGDMEQMPAGLYSRK